MNIQVTHLKNALVPSARRTFDAPPASIRSLAPTDWPHPYIALLDGEPVLRAEWELVIEDGQQIAFIDVAAIPQGGGGGGASNVLKIVAIIGVMMFAPYLGAFLGPGIFGAGVLGLSAAAWTGIATVVGMALVNAVFPAPKPTSPQQAAALAAPSPTYTLQAQGNTARIESAIPEHFGRMIAFPDFAAMPYGEFVGNEQFLYQLFCIGRGHYDIEKIRIEDSELSSFANITYEIVPPGGTLTLFPANVVTSTEVSGQELLTDTYVGPFVASSSGTVANTLGIDYMLPRGLFYAQDNGALAALTVTVQAEARQVNAAGVAVGEWLFLPGSGGYGSWSNFVAVGAMGPNTATEEYTATFNGVFRRTRTYYPFAESFTAATTTPQRYSRSYPVYPGRYEVRVKRLDTKSTSTRAGHEIVWAGLRSYLQDTRTYGDVTLLAMRMQASNSLSQQASRKINVIATRRLPTWTGTTWTANTPTRSIAWALAYVCKSVGLTDAQIDLAALKTLDATWATRGDTFDGRFDQFLSFWEAASKIAMAGRAKPYMQGGMLRVVRDQAATVPVALFSMRNIVKNSFNISYLMPTDDTADAVKASYFEEQNWKPATVTAKLPASTAAKPAKVDYMGIISRDQAFREATYQAACNRYRRKIIHFTTEMEGFIPSFLDLIAIQHDMPGWGQGGEVTAWDAASKTLTLSEPLQWQSGSPHYIALRKNDGSVSGPHAATAGAQSNQAVLANLPDITPYTGGNAERTHYSFGWADTAVQYARVISVKPRNLHTVDIECVAENSNVHTADQGIITPVRPTSQLSSYTNAPALLGLLAKATPNARHTVIVSWQPSPWANSYVVEQSADGSNWVRVGETGNTSLSFRAAAEVGTVIRVAAVALARGPWAQISYTMPPLENVIGLGIRVVENGVLISWQPALDQGYVATEIRRGSSWDTGTLITSKNSITHLMPWQIAGTVTLWAKHLDAYNGASAQAAQASIVIAPPNAVQVTRADVQVNTIAIGWANARSSQPIKSYAIYHGAGGATLANCELYSKQGADSQGDIYISRSAGVRRIYLIAEDVAGNTSAPTSFDQTVTLPTNFVLSSEWDVNWSGTKNNAYVEGTALVLPVNPSETWESHFASRSWATSDAQVAAGYPLVFEPGETTGSYVEQHDIGKIIPSAKISVTVQSTTLAGSLLPSVLIEWSVNGQSWTSGVPGVTDVQVSQVRYVRVTYSVTGTGGDDLVLLKNVHVVVSSEQLTEINTLALLASDASGTAYTCSKPFLDIVSVQVTPLNSSNIARLNTIIDDAVTPAKIYVQAWDTSNNRTSGSVSLQIGGY